jgi:hypothetical protein
MRIAKSMQARHSERVCWNSPGWVCTFKPAFPIPTRQSVPTGGMRLPTYLRVPVLIPALCRLIRPAIARVYKSHCDLLIKLNDIFLSLALAAILAFNNSCSKIVASAKFDHFCLELVSGEIAMRDLLPIIDDNEVLDECGNDGL